MNRLKMWFSENKDKPTFRHTVIIVVLIILSIGAQMFRNWSDANENAKAVVNQTTTKEETEIYN